MKQIKTVSYYKYLNITFIFIKKKIKQLFTLYNCVLLMLQ